LEGLLKIAESHLLCGELSYELSGASEGYIKPFRIGIDQQTSKRWVKDIPELCFPSDLE
jgi:hypothetical protein